MGNPSSKSSAQEQLKSKPWRIVDDGDDIWTKTAHDKMLEELKECFKGSDSAECANIVLLGPIDSGKSAFVNSVLSLGGKSVLASAASGSATHSYTTQLGVYDGRCATMGHVKLFDTMGLENPEGNGFNVNDVTLLLQGHIPKDYKFNPRSPITPRDNNYIDEPEISDRTHLVVFCLKADLWKKDAKSIPENLLRKVDQLGEKIKELDIPRMLLLTHVDILSSEVNSDISKIFHSTAVEEAVKKAGEQLHIPTAYIHPVQNYHGQPQTNTKMNVPLLLAMRHMLDISEDHVQRTY